MTKSTKRALVASILSLLLCVSMLIGSTFAWFTDIATSGVNKIISGNLDVELYYSSDMTGWQDAENSADDEMFGSNDLWEPGFTKVIYFKVKNAGNLALKYKIGTNLIENIIGKTANDDDIDLTNFINFAIVPTDTVLDGRDAVRSDANACHSFGDYSEELHLLPGEEDTFAFVAYMPEEVGNEANHGTGKTAPMIKFGIVVVATQDTVEYDSFDNQYDAQDAPLAFVRALEGDKLTINVCDYDGSRKRQETLDTGYAFIATEAGTKAEQSAYRYYHADFVVSTDKAIPANALTLAGYYESWCKDKVDNYWVGLSSDTEIVADTEIRLLETMLPANTWINYEGLCKDVVEFDCGLIANDPEAMAGTTITVELRLYATEEASAENYYSHNVETGEYVTVGVYSYTYPAN